MQHLKNITAGNPKTVEQYQLTKNFDVVWFFQKMVRTVDWPPESPDNQYHLNK
ncbi:hypothetical protein ECDEC14C_4679 [Escherichia coli DEC14C]|nr:hypothetical protein ECDEC14C_4679 [Escherichia coli DEC14C]